MPPRLLVDTHILVRLLVNEKKLSREQLRVLKDAVRRGEPIAFSASSLVEIAVLASGDHPSLHLPLERFLEELQGNAMLLLLPVTYEVAMEVAYLANLRDPADRTIVATARVYGLKLVTSDQRILESNLVPVVE